MTLVELIEDTARIRELPPAQIPGLLVHLASVQSALTPTFQCGLRTSLDNGLNETLNVGMGSITGAEIRRIRQRLGLTQEAFGRLVGVHFVTVSRWERGALGVRESAARLIRLLAVQEHSDKSAPPRKGR